MLKRLLKKILGETTWQSLRYRFRAHGSSIGKAEIYNYQTQLVIRRVVADGSFCVDIGCHRGYVLDMLLAQAPAGRFLAVEPLPDMFGHLQDRYGHRSNVRLVNAALSETAGTVEFCHVVSSPEYSGLRARSLYNGGSEEETTITVQTHRLDTLVDPTETVRFIKVDVEGAELQVFAGGEETIRRSRPFIVFEHGLGAADHFGTKPAQIFDLLHDRFGLQLSLMEDWLAGRAPLSREKFCAHFDQGLDFYYLAHP